MTSTIAILWGGPAVVMLGLWAWQLRSRDASSVDVAWAYLVGAAACAVLLLGDGDTTRRIVALSLFVVWSARLGTHLLIDRVLKAHGEDSRYAHWRDSAGAAWNRIAFVFFQTQAIFVAIFALPALALASDQRPFGSWSDWLGLAVWISGLLIGFVADAQLARWRRDPANRGRTCRQGLWRYSRHPNYFGEWLLWCAWPLIALGGPWGAWLWLHPLGVLLFLVLVTGIPFNERRALASRGDDYRRYQRSTSPFIPWPPRPENPS